MRWIGAIGLLVSLLLVLAVVSWLGKARLSSLPAPALPQQQASGAALPGGVNAPQNARQQARNIEQQYQQALDAAIKQHPMPD
ncbi:MAG: hypothetical protein LBP52_05725 [Burkholderiaceae bacterium]|jgi:hypothetical protein|nr:hypothetical protein [Burkholderiaceae bacterium]